MAAVPLPPTPPEAMAAPLPMVAVVGQQFCTPNVVALTITKKGALRLSKGEFVVSDVNGAVLMMVKGRVLSLHSHRVLCDAAGVPIISMREKIMSMHSTWRVYRGDSSDEEDLLFTVKQPHIFQLMTQLDVHVFLPGNDGTCDFKVKGSWYDLSCTFYLGDTNTIIALVSRQFELKNALLGRKTFGITVYPNVDYAFIVAIVVILNSMHREQ